MSELKTLYDEQIGALRAHSQAYDDGDEDAGAELATTIRAVVHDGDEPSLLTRLEIKDKLGFVDWAPPERPPDEIAQGWGLAIPRVRRSGETTTVAYRPASGSEIEQERRNPLSSFVDWWLLAVLDLPLTYTRADFVTLIAGAGDDELEAAYTELVEHDDLSVPTSDGPVQGPIGRELALASVRHIAQELIESLEQGVVWDANVVLVPAPVCALPISDEQARAAGRNDRCPCGSGRKLKRCFALRRPRNVTSEEGPTGLRVVPRVPEADAVAR